MKNHKIRIISGLYKGRKLNVVEAEGLRPTTDRIRETLFNWLGPLQDFSCLDLFAGSGALGIETLSRGAKKVTFVECNKHVFKQLQQNLSFIDESAYELSLGEASSFLKHQQSSFDLIFFDPPYQMEGADKLLKQALTKLAPSGLIYLESNTDKLLKTPGLVPHKELKTKNILCGVYRFEPSV